MCLFIYFRSHRRGSINPDTGDWVWSEEEEEEEKGEDEDVGENIPEGDDESDDEGIPLHIASPEERARRQKAIEMANRGSTSSSDDEGEHGRHSKGTHHSDEVTEIERGKGGGGGGNHHSDKVSEVRLKTK